MESQIPFQSRSHFARLSPTNSNSIRDTKECDSPIYNRQLYIYSVRRIMNAGYTCTRRSIEWLNVIYITARDSFFLSPIVIYLVARSARFVSRSDLTIEPRPAERPNYRPCYYDESAWAPVPMIAASQITATSIDRTWDRTNRLEQTESGEIWFKPSSAC